MSAIVIKFPRNYPASKLGRLNKLLADMAREDGLKLTANGLTYELEQVYRPSIADFARRVFCNPPAAHPNVVPMRRRPEPTFTPPTAA